ncbi:MAG: response regulator, partial [Firmicutes bacterium]|nr:response regulator [Bacillota bacterium]
SVFVFLILTVLFRIIAHQRELDHLLSVRYDEMKAELDAMTAGALAVFRVNLTKDEIEERGGTDLYDSDYNYDRYSEIMRERANYLVDPDYYETNSDLFTREGLLRHYESGQTTASEVLLVRRNNGEVGFVKLAANLTKKPVSGDVVAFITENVFDKHVIRNTLLNRVLMDHFDRIAYLIDGQYRVLLRNEAQKEGVLLPAEDDVSYESIYLNYILPALPRDRAKSVGQPNPLRLSVIDKALTEKPVYEYSAPFEIEGKTYYKQFTFYRIDVSAKYYLMLLSDTTKAYEDHQNLTRKLADALAQTAAGAAEPVRETVPAAMEPAPEAGLTPAGDSAPEGKTPGETGAKIRFVRPPHILLVDDNAINREIGELLLTAEGYRIELASDGKEALGKVMASESDPYDLVLMDFQMPVMNGIEATGRIRSLPEKELATIPIVALSASTDPQDMDDALAAGMNTHAAKPLEPEEIRRAIATVCPALVAGEEAVK